MGGRRYPAPAIREVFAAARLERGGRPAMRVKAVSRSPEVIGPGGADLRRRARL
jgi:hypothetical protein